MNLAWNSRNFADAPVDIIDGDRGKNYPKQDEFYKEGHCLFLNTGNITIDGFSFSDCQFITEDKDRALRKGKLTRQDVVMTTRGTIGNVGYFNYNVPYENIRINSGMVIFRTDENKLLASFLYQYLRSTIFNKKVQGIRSGAAQPQLPIRDIKTISIPLPLIEVQWRLVSILSAYDDLIENNRRRIVLLEEAARQLYKEWFIRFRFPGHKHVKIIDGIPEGWKQTVASEVMDILGGGTPKTTVNEFWNGNIPFYTPKDSSRSIYVMDSEKTISERGLLHCASKLYPKDTLFITARGTVGKLNLAQLPMAMNQSCYALIARKLLNQTFLYFSLDSAIQQFKSRASGSVFNAIIKDTFNVIPYVIPPAKIISEFCGIVNANVRQVDILLKQNHQLAQARDLLLPKLMNGEIAV